MKIKELNLKNFAAYDNVSVSFDPNITYLIGKNGAGKSTIGINAIHFILQGIAEKSSGGNQPLIGERFRFIGSAGASASGELVLFDDIKGIEVKVTRKLTKTGTQLSFEAPEGMNLDQQWLNDLFNMFMIAPKRFTELSGKEQAIALGIDTSKIDSEISELKQEFTGINRDLKQYDNLEPIEESIKIDLEDLHKQRSEIKARLNNEYLSNKEKNATLRKNWDNEKIAIHKEVSEHNENNTLARLSYNACFDAVSILKKEGYNGRELEDFIFSKRKQIREDKNAADLCPPEPNYLEEMPDDSELQAIDKMILEATQTNEKALLYTQYSEKLKAKQAKEKELQDNKDKQKQKEQERIAKILSYKFPFDNLTVNEDGELLLNNKPIKSPYFSTGQLLKIVPKLIATTNPELKYIFLQDFNLMDDELQKEVEEDLVNNGFQLVIEYVGKEKFGDRNCILLKDCKVVESL